jgi:hypothetical protein
MAGNRQLDFDHLAKSFANGMSRRSLLRGLVGAAGAALLAPFVGGGEASSGSRLRPGV